MTPLLAKRYKNRVQRLIIAFLALSPRAELYLKELKARRLQSVHHVRKIMALTEAYGHDSVARAVEDALEFNAFSSEYIINILEQRATEKQWSFTQYLRTFIEGEVQLRLDNKVARRISAARFPVIKSMESFDWSWPKKINQAQVQ